MWSRNVENHLDFGSQWFVKSHSINENYSVNSAVALNIQQNNENKNIDTQLSSHIFDENASMSQRINGLQNIIISIFDAMNNLETSTIVLSGFKITKDKNNSDTINIIYKTTFMSYRQMPESTAIIETKISATQTVIISRTANGHTDISLEFEGAYPTEQIPSNKETKFFRNAILHTIYTCSLLLFNPEVLTTEIIQSSPIQNDKHVISRTKIKNSIQKIIQNQLDKTKKISYQLLTFNFNTLPLNYGV